jgi:hypothetical protein
MAADARRRTPALARAVAEVVVGAPRFVTAPLVRRYDLFDNAARPSAERILSEYQQPKVGDWVPMASKVNETTAA